MSCIKQQSVQETKQKTIWAQQVGLSKKDGTTISVILKTTKKRTQKYQNTS